MTIRQSVDGIQILRGIAAMLVVIRHCAKEISGSDGFAVGQIGVDIFFVISGFVIYFSSRDLNWNIFLAKRIVRILPLYWFVTFLAFAGIFVQGEPVTAQTVVHIIYSLLFLAHESGNGSIFPTLYVGWTLNFEMWFYLMCTLALFLRIPLLTFASVVIFAAAATSVSMQIIGNWETVPLTLPLLPITLEFLAGMWLAHIFVIGGLRYTAPQACVGAGALFLLAIIWIYLAPIASPYTIWRPVIWGVPAVMIVTGTLMLEPHVVFRRFGAAMLIGNASYALYLIHPLVIRAIDIAVSRLTSDLGSVGYFLLLLIGSLAAGVVLHLQIEQRVLRILSRKFGLRKGNAFPTHLNRSETYGSTR